MRLPLAILIIGFVEWFLATERGWAISKGRGKKVAIIVLFENLFYFWVLFRLIENPNNWTLAVAYAIGATLGSLVCMRIPT